MTRTRRNPSATLTDSPIRTCLGCGRKLRKDALIRYVAKEGNVVIDHGQKASGRGAYCCDNEKCRQRFFKDRRRQARAFRMEIKRSCGVKTGSDV